MLHAHRNYFLTSYTPVPYSYIPIKNAWAHNIMLKIICLIYSLKYVSIRQISYVLHDLIGKEELELAEKESSMRMRKPNRARCYAIRL